MRRYQKIVLYTKQGVEPTRIKATVPVTFLPQIKPLTKLRGLCLETS